MKPLHYDIIKDDDCWQICLVFKDDRLPIPNKRYFSYDVARLMVRMLEKEDIEAWRQSLDAHPSREYDAEGNAMESRDVE